MGGALLAGWIDQGLPADQILVVEPAVDAERSSVPVTVSVIKNVTEIAETKVSLVNDYSRENQHPLLCTMEKA